MYFETPIFLASDYKDFQWRTTSDEYTQYI